LETNDKNKDQIAELFLSLQVASEFCNFRNGVSKIKSTTSIPLSAHAPWDVRAVQKKGKQNEIAKWYQERNLNH
jgi:hypothetical protein